MLASIIIVCGLLSVFTKSYENPLWHHKGHCEYFRNLRALFFTSRTKCQQQKAKLSRYPIDFFFWMNWFTRNSILFSSTSLAISGSDKEFLALLLHSCCCIGHKSLPDVWLLEKAGFRLLFDHFLMKQSNNNFSSVLWLSWIELKQVQLFLLWMIKIPLWIWLELCKSHPSRMIQ